MDRTEPSLPGIEIAESGNELSGQAASMGGLTFLVFAMAMTSGLVRNQWQMFPMFLVLLGFGFLFQWGVRWLDRYATHYWLSSDSMRIGDVRLELNDIDSIKWPTSNNSDQKLQLKIGVIKEERDRTEPNVEAESDDDDLCFSIDLNKLEREDRLLLIRYLQKLDCEHRQWAEFCSLYLDNWLQPKSKLFSKRIEERLKVQPFWAGFIYTPYVAMVCCLTVSIQVYFILAATIAVSALVNIRLMHGQWFSPVGETVLGIAACLFVLGIVVAVFPKFQRKRVLTPASRKSSRQAAVLLVFALTLGPLVVMLLLKNGWVLAGQLIMQLLPWTPVIPLIAGRLRERKQLRADADLLLPNVTKKWEAYCTEVMGEVRCENSTEANHTSTQTAPLDSDYVPFNSSIHSGNFSTGSPTTVDSKPSTI